MDPGNAREALREAALDVEEGADALMVKPALGYLDVVRSVRERFPELPLAAYNVSGEYAMVKAAAANGWLDERAVVLEVLTGIRRAGADLVVTYHAKDAAAWLQTERVKARVDDRPEDDRARGVDVAEHGRSRRRRDDVARPPALHAAPRVRRRARDGCADRRARGGGRRRVPLRGRQRPDRASRSSR